MDQYMIHECAEMRWRQNSIAAKWNIFLSFGLKVPFGFPCFAHVCLESWLGLVFFSAAYVTLAVALLFGGLVLLLAFLWIFSIGFCRSVAARSLFEVGALACFYAWSILMRQPPAKVKNREIAFVFCFGLPSVWERSTKLRIHRSHSYNFFYHSYSRILAPHCNSSHITKAIAIEWGVKSSLNATW